MDILEIEDVLKGLPDQALMQEAQQPTGQVPQYMVVSEIQRRSKMRKSFEAQKEQPSTTIAEQILTGGVASVAPPPPQMIGAMGMPQQPPAPPQQSPMGQQQPPMPPQQMPPQQPPMPQQGAPMPAPVQMAGGGVVKMASGEMTPYSDPQGLIVQALEQGVPGSVLTQQAPQFADLINRLEAQMLTKMGVDQYENIKQDYNIPYGREFDSDLASAPAGPMEEIVVTGQRETAQPVQQIDSSSGNYIPSRVSRGMTIDTGIENLFGDVDVLGSIDDFLFPPRPMVGTTPGAQRGTARNELAPLGEMPTRISEFGTYSSKPEEFAQMVASLDVEEPAPPIGELSGNIRRRARETAKGIEFKELFPGRPSTGGQMARGRKQVQDAVALADVVVDPKQSAATQVDSAKLNLDTATKSDGPLLDMALSEKSITDFSIDPDLQRQANEIIGDRSELVSRGTPDIQMQGIKYVSPETPELVAPSFAGLISEQERRLAKIREDVKRDVGAQALINLGAGVMEGDVAGGLRAAGQAASKVRTAERAAESDIANLQTRIKMAEEQGKFDTAKALRADAVKEAQFEATFGLKRGELGQTLRIAEARIEAEGDTEKGRALRARLTALNDLASRLQAQIATTGIKDPATDAALQQALGQLQSLLGVEVADSDNNDPAKIR